VGGCCLGLVLEIQGVTAGQDGTMSRHVRLAQREAERDMDTHLRVCPVLSRFRVRASL
jgi:hypothetical protein